MKDWERTDARSEEWKALACGLLFGAALVGMTARWGHVIAGILGLLTIARSWVLKKRHWKQYREACERDARAKC